MFGLIGDLVKIVAAPVVVVAEVARTVTKPVADAAVEVAKTVKEVVR